MILPPLIGGCQIGRPHSEFLSVSDLKSRAWDVLLRSVRAALTQHSPKVWEASVEDVQEGAALVPFLDIDEL